ncbi:MAG: hypothetical protein SH850_31700 [Planctomycetaceae bacterium]|nr:hypothetical protein [Planctomycetaceae bacterium]
MAENDAIESTRVVVELSGEIRVTLCADDLAFARRIGLQRTDEALRMNRPGRADCPPNNPRQDVDAAAAELAFARAIGVPPSLSVTPDPGPDVAEFHVRATWRPDGHLIVRPGEAKDNCYVLLIGEGVRWRVIGTITGRNAMRQEFWRTPNARPGCYMVPQSQLTRLPLRVTKPS